jgi:four helix bundle protein
MSRDHEKLRVFHDAHALTTAIYRQTREFPRDEWFGLRAQMRRTAVSVACNMVEGNARGTTRDYLRFLHMALGSASELKYLIALVDELETATEVDWAQIKDKCDHVVRQLQRLVDRMDSMAATETVRERRFTRVTGTGD